MSGAAAVEKYCCASLGQISAADLAIFLDVSKKCQAGIKACGAPPTWPAGAHLDAVLAMTNVSQQFALLPAVSGGQKRMQDLAMDDDGSAGVVTQSRKHRERKKRAQTTSLTNGQNIAGAGEGRGLRRGRCRPGLAPPPTVGSPR